MTVVLSAAQDQHHFNNVHMYSTSSPSHNSHETTDWKAKYYAVEEMLQETRNELDDFQQSSKELEEELERELERTERAQEDLKDKVIKVEGERDEWKAKFMSLQQTHTTTTNSLQRELDAFRQREAIVKVQLRELEMGNDDLERNERQATSSLADLEGKFTRALEEKILLEHELQDKAVLEETCQRLRDELRDVNSEVAVLKEQLQKPPPEASHNPFAVPSASSLNLPTASTESLLRSKPPADLLSQPHPPRRESASGSAISIQSRFSSHSDCSASDSLTMCATPTQASAPTSSILNRALSPVSTSSGSRLPRRPINTPLPASPMPLRVAPRTSVLPRSKGMNMVSEMRARVRTLEQKIHVNMPRLRVGAASAGGSQVGNSRLPMTPANRLAGKENAKVFESPGWVVVPENGESPAPSPARPVPPPDFTKASVRPPSSTVSERRTVKPSLSHANRNPRSRSPPPQLTFRIPEVSLFPGPEPVDLSSPLSRDLTFTSSTTKPFVPPSKDRLARPVTPSGIPQGSGFRKASAVTSKPLSSKQSSPKRRGSAGPSGTNVTHAGATPGRMQRSRNVTTPATPPPPLPSFRATAKTLNTSDPLSTAAASNALARSRLGSPSKSKIGRPHSSALLRDGEDSKGRDRSGTLH